MTIKFKVVLVGSTEQHEETLLIDERELEQGDKYETNLGLNLKLEYKLLGDKDVNLVLWLMKGEKFHEIKQGFYEGADGIVVLFDISQEESIESIIFRIKELRQNSPNSSILLIGRNIKDQVNQIIDGYTRHLIKEGKIKGKISLNIDFFDLKKTDKLISKEFLEFLARKLLSRSDY